MTRRATLFLFLLFVSACATTGSTFRSGVGDAQLSHAPWYAGARTTPVAAVGVRVGAMRVVYQIRGPEGALFDPSAAPSSPVAGLLREMNAYLDSITAFNGTGLVRVLGEAPSKGVVPPDVRFGCLTDGEYPGAECTPRGDSVLGRGDRQTMKLSVGRPSAAWAAWASQEMGGLGLSHALVVTLEVGEYLMRQSGLVGRKSVELGTHHTASLPWLTSLETPVQVLQLTGALVSREGPVVRIGAEGIMARRTRLAASAAGLQEMITDADVEQVRSLRRDDLAGQPLAWKEALRQLIHGLTR